MQERSWGGDGQLIAEHKRDLQTCVPIDGKVSGQEEMEKSLRMSVGRALNGVKGLRTRLEKQVTETDWTRQLETSGVLMPVIC